MLFLLAILGMLITRKQYTTQEVEKRSKKGTKRVVPIVHHPTCYAICVPFFATDGTVLLSLLPYDPFADTPVPVDEMLLPVYPSS